MAALCWQRKKRKEYTTIETKSNRNKLKIRQKKKKTLIIFCWILSINKITNEFDGRARKKKIKCAYDVFILLNHKCQCDFGQIFFSSHLSHFAVCASYDYFDWCKSCVVNVSRKRCKIIIRFVSSTGEKYRKWISVENHQEFCVMSIRLFCKYTQPYV